MRCPNKLVGELVLLPWETGRHLQFLVIVWERISEDRVENREAGSSLKRNPDNSISFLRRPGVGCGHYLYDLETREREQDDRTHWDETVSPSLCTSWLTVLEEGRAPAPLSYTYKRYARMCDRTEGNLLSRERSTVARTCTNYRTPSDINILGLVRRELVFLSVTQNSKLFDEFIFIFTYQSRSFSSVHSTPR